MGRAERFVARVDIQGRVTIPSVVRRLLGIDYGDIVEVTVKKVREAPEP